MNKLLPENCSKNTKMAISVRTFSIFFQGSILSDLLESFWLIK